MKNAIFTLSIVLVSVAAGAQAPILAADINTADSSSPSYLTVMNNKLYFYANDGSHGRELYSYSETSGASLIADVLPGSNSGSTGPASSNMAVLNNKLYFVAGTPSQKLYVFDGTNPASVVGAPASNFFHPMSLATINGKLYFSADSSLFDGDKLWSYDGIKAPTKYNVDNPGYTLAGFKGNVYFNSHVSDWNLTTLNPLTDSTSVITSASQSSGFTQPFNLLATNSKLYFIAKDTAGFELYGYDGTTAMRLTNIAVGADKSGAKGPLAEYNGSVYFSGSTDGANYQLYRFNPASGVVSLVSTINPSGSADIQSMIACNGKLYFSAITPSAGRELWSYDGSLCQMVADLNPGPAHGMPLTGAIYENGGLFAILNNHLYFSGDDGVHGQELFVLNTSTGVQEIRFEGEVKLYPNPVGNVAMLDISTQKAQQIRLSAYDITGRLLLQIAHTLMIGKNTITLPAQNLAAGHYVYQISDAQSNQRLSGSIFIKK